MTRRCERPGCAEPASVSFRFDPRRRLVELFPGLAQSDTEAGALCRRHGDAMVLPRGWVLDDQRDLTPRLFTVERPAAPGSEERPARTRRRQRPTGADTTLFVIEGSPPPATSPDEVGSLESSPPDTETTDGALTVAEVAGAHPDSNPDETRAMPWVPVFDAGDNLGGVLDATTPLLRKAFGTDHRERRR